MSEKDNTPIMHDVTEDFHQDGDRVVRQTSQHIPPDFLANLKRQREASMSAKEGELMKVASIPVAVAEKWRKEGFDIYREGGKAIIKRLHDEGLDGFLATNKRI
jgi:hypothetical protein